MWAELKSYAWMSPNKFNCSVKQKYKIQHLTPCEHWNPSKLLMNWYKRKSFCSVSKTKQCCKPCGLSLCRCVYYTLHYTLVHCTLFLITFERACSHLMLVCIICLLLIMIACVHTHTHIHTSAHCTYICVYIYMYLCSSISKGRTVVTVVVVFTQIDSHICIFQSLQ